MTVYQDFRVYPEQIPASLIDRLLKKHEDFKRSRLSIFRAQGTTQFERPQLDEFGNQVNSIQNPHLLGFHPEFRQLVEQIIYHENIGTCLTDFTGSMGHTNYQSMLFDKSTGTKLHQDTWYLDTDPAGSLVGVWIALEDIEADAGPFCIFENAAQEKVDYSAFDFENLENDERFRDSFPNYSRHDFLARKGDILIWKSFAIHGANMPIHPSKTRKSLTAHFYPSDCKIQDPPIKRGFSIYDHDSPVPTINKSLKKAATINPAIYNTMCMVLGGLGGISKFVTGDTQADANISEIRRIES